MQQQPAPAQCNSISHRSTLDPHHCGMPAAAVRPRQPPAVLIDQPLGHNATPPPATNNAAPAFHPPVVLVGQPLALSPHCGQVALSLGLRLVGLGQPRLQQRAAAGSRNRQTSVQQSAAHSREHCGDAGLCETADQPASPPGRHPMPHSPAGRCSAARPRPAGGAAQPPPLPAAPRCLRPRRQRTRRAERPWRCRRRRRRCRCRPGGCTLTEGLSPAQTGHGA